MFTTDTLITDYSGISFEYDAISTRPIIFIDVDKKIINQEFDRYTLEPVEISLRSSYGSIVSANPEKVIQCLVNLKNTKTSHEALYKKSDLIYNMGSCGKVASHLIWDMIS